MSLKAILDKKDQKDQQNNNSGGFRPWPFFVKPGLASRIVFVSNEFSETVGRNMFGLIDGIKFARQIPELDFLDTYEDLKKELHEKESDKPFSFKHRKATLGVATCICIGQVTYDDEGNQKVSGFQTAKGVVVGAPRLIIGKLGSADYPTAIRRFILKALQKPEVAKNGLYGTVWDFSRSGAKVDANGDDFEFVTRLKSEQDIREYLLSYGTPYANDKAKYPVKEWPIEDSLPVVDQAEIDLLKMKFKAEFPDYNW